MYASHDACKDSLLFFHCYLMDFSFLANLTLTAWVLEFLCGFPMCISLFSFNYEFYNLQINSFYFFFFSPQNALIQLEKMC